ncbi:MAG TPA: hypothetical protein VGE35_01795 [Candidatus Paceibacterota bacterium]
MTSSSPAEITPPAIANESIVVVCGTSFDGCEGLVIDVASNLVPEDGPIAVYFDKEVDAYKFVGSREAEEWKGGIPTLENYRNCPRVICFEPTDLKPIGRFSPLVRANRLFGKDRVRDCSSPNFPLVPGTHECHLKDCPDGASAKATHSALINVWGGVYEVYVCKTCFDRANGMCCDSFELKKPLPRQSKES